MRIALAIRLILAMAWSWCPHSAREPSGLPQQAALSASRSELNATRSARSAFRFCCEDATEIVKQFFHRYQCLFLKTIDTYSTEKIETNGRAAVEKVIGAKNLNWEMLDYKTFVHYVTVVLPPKLIKYKTV